MKCFTAVVAFVLSVPLFAIADERCSDLLTKKTHQEAIAEGILASYAPYQYRPFRLEPLSQNQNAIVFLGSEIDLPKRKFILKVMPLGEALSDFYALRLIRGIQKEIRIPISVVDSVVLTPRLGTLASETLVLQKNSLARGRTLFEILADEQVATDRKSYLRNYYMAWIHQMAGALKKKRFLVETKRLESNFYRNQHRFIETHPNAIDDQPIALSASRLWDEEMRGKEMEPLFQYLDRASRGVLENLSSSGNGISIILKTDNIMVDDSDHMVLFDPF